jgi:hypothetical protein
VSVYFGLSSGLQWLDVSFVSIELLNNWFSGCVTSVSTEFGGNSYGGGVSIYIGGYSSSMSVGIAQAIVGATIARNVSITVSDAIFSSCSAERSSYDRELFGVLHRLLRMELLQFIKQ